MNVLILTNYFPPEVGGAAHLYFELAESLVQRGHKVTVVTGFPRYNVDELPEQYRGKRRMWEDVNGARLLRLWTPSMPRTNLILRGLEHFIVPLILFLGGLFSGPQDIVLIYSPPLPFGLAAWALSRVRNIPFVVNIQDLFPKEAVILGLLKNKILIRAFEAIERFIYRKADYVTLHSPGNRQHVLDHGGDPQRAIVLHNWVDTEKVRPQEKENDFRHQHGLEGRFVVSYAGTMGWCQDMSIIVQAAERLKAYPDMLFLMVGEGPEKVKTEEVVLDLQLGNIQFLPMQPWREYPNVLAASDISMINLNHNLTTPVVPSKLLNIMAAGRAVVASLPLDGDAPKIIAEAQCGACVAAEDAEGMADAILDIYKNPEKAAEMGRNGRRYAEAHFSREACVGQYEKIFYEAARRWGKTV